MTDQIKKHYDSLFYTDIVAEYYGQSLFGNFGLWDGRADNAHGACENLVQKLLDFLPAKQGNILDVACGRGGTTNYLRNYYDAGAISAINFSQKQLDTAREMVPGCQYYCMDAAKLDFPDESFDNIICVEAAFHFLTRQDFLRHAHRVLKPGGRLILSDVLIKEGGEKAMRTFHEGNYLPDPDAYRALCYDAGFGDVQVEDLTETTWHGHYWNIVRFTHDKFLSGEFDRATLEQFLDNTYRFAPWMNRYLVACLGKN